MFNRKFRDAVTFLKDPMLTNITVFTLEQLEAVNGIELKL